MNRTDVPKEPENVTSKDGGWVRAAMALAVGKSVAKAAQDAGVDPRTVRRWQKKLHFLELVEQFRTELLEKTVGRLFRANTKAVQALVTLLTDDQSSIRLGAASRLLDLSFKARKLLELENELEEQRKLLTELMGQHPELFKSKGTNNE